MSTRKYNESPARRYLAYVGIYGITQLHLRNPFVVACWSALFPGMGHLLLSKYLKGFLLFTWEVVINYMSHINLLILYTFIGDFEKAKQVVDIRWMSLYIPTYLFAIWDSYRTTVDLNHTYILASREDAEVKCFEMRGLGINYLDKRNPWVSAAWSFLFPGAGEIYIHRLITGSFSIVWWITICYLSRVLPAFHYTLVGDFYQAKSVLNMHWFLNIPSIYFFAVYDSYSNTVSLNNLFDWEQERFLRKCYQNPDFVMPGNMDKGGNRMYIVSTFDHSVYLELAITAMERKGIKKDSIFAVPIDKNDESRKLFDSIHSSDGVSLFDLPVILGTFFGIFGSIYGFTLLWGPLLCGLLAIILGIILGLIIKLYLTRKYNKKNKDNRGTEVVLIINCIESQIDMVKDILWSHNALGISKLDMKDN